MALSLTPGEAHKAITSKYTYNDDVFPILRDQCARCHVAGGVAPMSLMTYDEAFPWAESIRAELVATHMPPWNAEEGFGELKRAHTLSPQELDIILTWATGGNPRGALDQKLPPVTLKNDWTMGAPDLALPLPSEFTVAADKMEDSARVHVPTGTNEPRWVRAVDLLPGTPSIVRSAVISVKRLWRARSASERIARAGARAGALASGPGSRADRPAPRSGCPRARSSAVRIHYKKTWQFEGKPLTDRSTVGIYFAQDAGRARTADAADLGAGARRQTTPNDVTFSQTIERRRAGARAQPGPGAAEHLAAGGRDPARRVAHADDPPEHAPRLGSRATGSSGRSRCRAARASRSRQSSTIRTSCPRPSAGRQRRQPRPAVRSVSR